MRLPFKTLVVFAGYGLALLAGAVAQAAWLARSSLPPGEAGGGMAAFGDLLVFVAGFGVVALIPSGLALIFMRPKPRLWNALGLVALLLALTGGAAAAALLAPHALIVASGSGLDRLAEAAPLRLLPSPLLAAAIGLAFVAAPVRRAQRLLLAATAIEGLSGLAAWGYWLASLAQR